MASSSNSKMVAIGQTYPAYLPPYSTLYWFYLQWRELRVRRSFDESFAFSSTIASLKKPQWTTLMMIDSQAVKNTFNASIASLMLLFSQINQWY
ncbi:MULTISPECIES: hypothetical protein [unclassified Microcoleus]|uniref:hypothetical protein n=1 Tax=unclassified Microcoleus TaxID=2642155 RepID=UPI002FD4063D